MQGCNGTESNGLNRILANKEIVGKCWAPFFSITSSSSHFFNKTDFEKYLLSLIK